MSDKIPGSSFDNPIWYKKYRIYLSDNTMSWKHNFEYVHDDYDRVEDACDNRCGYGESIEDCKEQIDEI